MKEKMYLIQKTINTMFVSSSDNMDKVRKEGLSYLEEEIECNGIEPSFAKEHQKAQLIEITTEEQIPEIWNGYCLLWGTEDEITPIDFLQSPKNNEEEYNKYLMLKNKMETSEEHKLYLQLKEKYGDE